MRITTCVGVLASLVLSTEALRLPKRQEGSPQVVGLNTERRAVPNPVQRDRLRRRASVQATLDNQETLYFVNATLGTPAQSIRLHLDTGSSDLWVNTADSALCQQQSDPCKFSGTYNANSSSSYEYVGSYFNISYVDGSGASGDYVSDTITIGDQKLDRLQFGVGYDSTSAQGILGIGYEVNEVQVGRAGKQAYRNLPSQMTQDKLTQSNSYSLWLNDLSSNQGSILFGGIDSEKFEGSLQTLPIQANSGVFAEFLITLTGLKLGSSDVGSDLALAVLLDSGSSLTYLPDSMVETIYNAVGAQYDAQEGAAYVPCSLADEKSDLTFTFTAPSIAVEMNELVLDLVTDGGRRPRFSDGTSACLFGIAPAGSGTNVLGDTFLRSAYVVYDLDNNQISLAQTRFNSTATRVQEIGSGPDSVPGATTVSNAVKATDGVVSGQTDGIGSPGSGSSAAPPALLSPRGSMFAAAIALAAGVLLTAV